MSPGRKLFLSLAMILAALWIYWPAMHGGWIWDDKTEIPKIAALGGPGLLHRIWVAPDTGDYYPLKVTVEWLQWKAWGQDTIGYHLTNVLLHAASGLLLWQLLRRFGVRCARFAGLLFIVHPLAVESVAWIDEIKNTLSLPFLLLAMIAYVKSDEKGSGPEFCNDAKGLRNSGPDPFYGASLLCFLLAMLSKSSVVMFPVGLLLYAWWRHGKVRAADLRAAAPFFLISFVLGLVAIHFQREFGLAGGAAVLPLGGPVTRLARAGLVAAFYLGKALWPVHLLPIYPRWPIDASSPTWLLPWVALGGIGAWCWANRRTWGRHVIFGLGWFFLNLVPVLGFIPISHFRFTWAMDHLAYVSLLGVAGLAAGGLCAAERRWAQTAPGLRWSILGACAAVCAVLALASRTQAARFGDEVGFWTYEMEGNPQASMAQNNLGGALFERGDAAAAIAHYREALRIEPDLVSTHLNLANALGSLGRWPEALAEDREALRLQPGWASTHKILADTLSRAGRPAEAIEAYRRALEIRPDFAQAENGLGSALFRTGDIRGAYDHFQAALRLNPDYAEAHNNLAVILAGTGHRDEAIGHFEAAVRLKPDYAEARVNLEAARR